MKEQSRAAVSTAPLQSFFSYLFLVIVVAFLMPQMARAAEYEVGGWVPWWSEEAGAESALENIESLDVVYPFVFEVDAKGKLVNKVDFSDDHWKELFAAAKDEEVLIIPTIAWFDGDQMHEVLGSRSKRKAHINDIVKMVKKYKFDGVNVDYESRLAETRDHYSLFLKELNRALRSKDLTCTIEARTPPESRWREVPKVIEYSNDYKEINKHCDWVEIMAYDQQRADIKLNDERRGVPYAPVADKAWVDKVLDLAVEDIDPEKILLGVPTYGRAWDVTVASEWYKDYKLAATLNNPRIQELAKKYNSPIGRTAGGEAVISYFPEDSKWKMFNQLPTPKNTPKGFEATAKALQAATLGKTELSVRFITWSDAKAVEDKLDLVEKYGLRGVAIFKVDGEEDEDIWKLF